MGVGKKDEAAENAMEFQKDQMKRLEGLSLPELKEYVLQNPELVGLLDAETIEDTGLSDIQLDPALRQNQMDALSSLKERSEEGLTAEDKYAMETMLGDVSAQERSQMAGIEDQMARQGMDSSGFAERSKREAVQSGSNNARAKAMQMAAQGQQNRMAALQALGSQSGQMEQADYGRKANAASAQDAISRANAMNKQNVSGQNLAARQAIENQRASTANQQGALGNSLAQQNFNNQVTQVTGQGNVGNAMSNIAGNAQQGPSGLQAGLAGAASGFAATGNPWGAAAGGAMGLLSSMEDGGIAQKDNLPIQYQQQADMAEYKAAETKQHESFKKKYMKRVQDEVMGSSDKPKTPEHPQSKEDGGVIHAQDGFNFGSLYKMKGALGNNPELQDISGNNPEEAAKLEMIAAMRAKENAAKAVPESSPEESGMSNDKMSKGLSALSKMMKQPKKTPLKLGSFSMDQPENVMPPMEVQQFADGGQYISDGYGDIVDSGEDSFAGDRVDAKINDGEMVVNVPQQQRLMDLIRGEISVDELGTDDIVEGVPRELRDEIHEESENTDKIEGIQALLEMLEK